LVEQTTDAVYCYEYDPPIPTDIPLEEQVKQLYRGVLVECNDVCAKSYGATQPKEVIGKKLNELFGTVPGSLDGLFTAFVQNGYRMIDAEGGEVLDDGTQRYFLNNGHGTVENDVLVRVWGTFRDITERKRLEEQLRQAQKMEAIGRLAGGVSHDFNNLLTSIMGYTELALLALHPSDPVRSDLEGIQRTAERAAGLTRQLLAFARKQVINPTVLNLNDLILNVDKILRRLIGEDIELVTLAAPDLGQIKADSGQLEQVLLNLAVNARDAMPNGGKLTIKTTKKRGTERVCPQQECKFSEPWEDETTEISEER
jgi:signal transduction histidine kinase